MLPREKEPRSLSPPSSSILGVLIRIDLRRANEPGSGGDGRSDGRRAIEVRGVGEPDMVSFTAAPLPTTSKFEIP